jgi:hypothetical protein
MFCAPGPVFGGTDGVGSSFYVLRSRTHFQRHRGHGSCFHVSRSRTRFRRYRRLQVQFSCFPLPDPFSAVPTASGPIFMFCAPRLIFVGAEGVVSRFHVLRSRTRFRRYRRVASRFMFWARGHVFGSTDGVGSCFNVFHSETHFRRYRRRRVQL